MRIWITAQLWVTPLLRYIDEMKFRFWYLFVFLAVVLVFVEYLRSDRTAKAVGPEQEAVKKYYDLIVRAEYDACLAGIGETYKSALSASGTVLDEWKKAEDIVFYFENVKKVKFLKMRTSVEDGLTKVSFKARLEFSPELEEYFGAQDGKKTKVYFAGHRFLDNNMKLVRKKGPRDTVMIAGFSNEYIKTLKAEGFPWYESLRPSTILD